MDGTSLTQETLLVAARVLTVASNLSGALDHGFTAQAWAHAQSDLNAHEAEEDWDCTCYDPHLERDRCLDCGGRYGGIAVRNPWRIVKGA
jgi:hypothetical protein